MLCPRTLLKRNYEKLKEDIPEMPLPMGYRGSKADIKSFRVMVQIES